MEGRVVLQSEGHIGVLSLESFNVSIEAKRLPAGYRWHDLMEQKTKSPEGAKGKNNGRAGGTPLVFAEEDEDVLVNEELKGMNQMHTTGYWVDDQGCPLANRTLSCRIKNYDLGMAGEYGFISIEGTMLEPEAEKLLAAEEREREKLRKMKHNPLGLLRPISRRLPEFSMTKFGKEDQEEVSGQRAVLYKGSRPTTPDDD